MGARDWVDFGAGGTRQKTPTASMESLGGFLLIFFILTTLFLLHLQ